MTSAYQHLGGRGRRLAVWATDNMPTKTEENERSCLKNLWSCPDSLGCLQQATPDRYPSAHCNHRNHNRTTSEEPNLLQLKQKTHNSSMAWCRRPLYPDCLSSAHHPTPMGQQVCYLGMFNLRWWASRGASSSNLWVLKHILHYIYSCSFVTDDGDSVQNTKLRANPADRGKVNAQSPRCVLQGYQWQSAYWVPHKGLIPGLIRLNFWELEPSGS